MKAVFHFSLLEPADMAGSISVTILEPQKEFRRTAEVRVLKASSFLVTVAFLWHMSAKPKHLSSVKLPTTNISVYWRRNIGKYAGEETDRQTWRAVGP
jgi:hypothetical protein